MEYAEFKKQVKAGAPTSVYLFAGFGQMERDKGLELLEQSPKPPGGQVLRESYAAPEQVATALASARSYPMWGEHKLIVLSGIDSLADEGQEKALNSLLTYVRDPSSWVTLVLVSAKELSPGGPLKRLVQEATVVLPPKVTSDSLADWIYRTAASAGLHLEPDAVERLLEMTQGDWGTLEKEVEKIVAAFPAGSAVKAEALDFVVEPRLEESVFTLLRLLGEGQTGKALEVFDRLVLNAAHPKDVLISLWYWLYRQVRELFAAQEVATQGLDNELLQALGVNPKIQNKLRQQSKRYSKSDLWQMLQTLERIDRQIKSSYTTLPRFLLEHHIVRLGQVQQHRHS